VPSDKAKLRFARLRAFEDFENFFALAESLFLSLFRQGESLIAIKRAIESLTTKLIEGVDDKNRCCFEIITNIEFGNRFISHSLKTAMISVIIGKGMQLQDSKLVAVVTGALLHDVGKMQSSNNPFMTPFFSKIKSPQELKARHPSIGGSIVSEFLGFNSEVAQCVSNHHEQLDGTGYPRKIFQSDISPLDRAVFTANFAENLLEQSKYEGSEQFFTSALYAFEKFPLKFDPAIKKVLQEFRERPAMSRRSYERVDITLTANFHTTDSYRVIPCRILDLSGGGARMRCREIMQPGTNIVISFAIGHAMTFNDVSCKIVRHFVEGDAHQYGMVFQDKNGLLGEKLDRYLHRYVFKS
jgi:putative nucleotidyltransferase with HDIG domain